MSDVLTLRERVSSSEFIAPALTTPYRGLVPYSEEDAPFFFGREPEREIITANLIASRLTLLYGASGVGKSSVLRAGVAHHLRELAQQNLAERGTAEVAIVVFSSWRDDPLLMLQERIAESVESLQVAGGDQVRLPDDPLTHFAEFLDAWTRRIDADLLIILDQFEQYFLYHAHADGPGTFAVEFPRAVNRPGLRASFLVSIREDALAQLDRFKGRIPNLFDNYLRVEHLGREAARAAIEEPLERYNQLGGDDRVPVRIEPELVDAVLEQVKTGQVVLGEAGRGIVGEGRRGSTVDGEVQIETPFLQLVMTRLWDEEMRAGSRVLRHATLERLGGAEQIVRTHLDAAMETFSPAEQDAAARIFRMLVTPSGTKIAHTVGDLADYAEVKQERLEPVLDQLSGLRTRILRPIAPPPDQPSAPRYEIFHDVLAPAILDWRRRYVERQAQEAIRLEQAQQREQEHAEAERQRAVERSRHLRRMMIAMGVALAALVVLLVYAWEQRDQARSAQRRAEEANLQARAAAALAEERAEKFVAGTRLRQVGLYGDFSTVLNSRYVNDEIRFRATATPAGTIGGTPAYAFRIFPGRATLPTGPDSVAIITYRLEHPTFPYRLIATGPKNDFTASYRGWGCINPVIAVIEYANPDKEPSIAAFDQCALLRRREQ